MPGPAMADQQWWQLPWAKLRLGLIIIWRAIVHFVEDDGPALAGYIAYAGLFALFPFVIFLTTLAGMIGQVEAVGSFIQQSLEQLPQEVSAVIRVPIEEVIASPRTGLMTISILVTLWAASSGLEALRTALNLAYGVDEPRGFLWRRLQSLILTLLLSISILLLMIVEVAGPLVWGYVQKLADMPVVWGWARWLYEGWGHVSMVALFYAVIVLLYRVLPNRPLRWLEILPGAAVTVVLWIGLARLFSFYLQNLGRFTWTYGSLGGIIITLLFFYLSALIFVFGAEINSASRRTKARLLRDARARRAAASAHLSQPGTAG